MGDQSIKKVIPSDRTRDLRIHEVVRVEKSIKQCAYDVKAIGGAGPGWCF